jgi:phosphopantothenate synthetase
VINDVPATITALTALIVAVGAFVLNFLKGRAAERSAERAALAAEAALAEAQASKAAVIAVDGKVYALGKQLDGQLSKLLAEIKEGAYAAGRLDEAADGQVASKIVNGEPKP